MNLQFRGIFSRLRQSAFVKNVLIVMTGTAAAQAIGFALTPVISRLYSPSDFGVFGSFDAVLTVIAAGVTLDYSQAVMLPKEKKDAINLFMLSCASAVIFCIISLAACLLLPGYLQGLMKAPNVWVLPMLVAAILVTGMNQSCQAWCVRVKAFKDTSASQVIRSLSSSGMQIGFGLFRGGSVWLIVSSILADIFASLNLARVVVRDGRLRWPVPGEIQELVDLVIHRVSRRAKYLLLDTAAGSALLHLGMSGSLRVLPGDTPVRAHDHVDIALDSGRVLRFNDPRRFGCLLWQAPGETHALLAGLGPEPLSDDFDGAAFDGNYLFATSRGRKAPVKTFLMDQSVVVGVGNIYAAEALFLAGISPLREAGKVSRARYVALADAVKAILAHAINRGGTTLRDFISPDGAPGYFEQELLVYGRGGEPCPRCGRTLKQAPIGQRASVWCGHCQR